MNKKNVIYFCEGHCEKRFIDTIKNTINSDTNLIVSGKSFIINLASEHCKRIIQYLDNSKKSVIIIDTDRLIQNTAMFLSNIVTLKKYSNAVLVILQHENFEDEIIKSTIVKDKNELYRLLNTKSESEFKSNFCQQKNSVIKILEKEFNIKKYGNHKQSNNRNLKQIINEIEEKNCKVIFLDEIKI